MQGPSQEQWWLILQEARADSYKEKRPSSEFGLLFYRQNRETGISFVITPVFGKDQSGDSG